MNVTFRKVFKEQIWLYLYALKKRGDTIIDLIRKQIKNLIGKKVKVFFKYNTISYNIKKSGKLLECDDKFFIIDEVKDGVSGYSYEFVNAVMEDKQ